MWLKRPIEGEGDMHGTVANDRTDKEGPKHVTAAHLR